MTTLAEKDKAYIWHPFTPQKANREIIPIVAAKGAWLADEKGNQYLDAI
ncbi:MAG: adenosylmethionine--8-amino-7-oxononanoate aminotransferase BioA, partial [Sphingobacteriia bacterium]